MCQSTVARTTRVTLERARYALTSEDFYKKTHVLEENQDKINRKRNFRVISEYTQVIPEYTLKNLYLTCPNS